MLNRALPQNPEWLTTNLGPPPRAPSLLKCIALILKKRLFPGRFEDSPDPADLSAYIDGIATWGMLIKANRNVYTPKAEGDRFLGVSLVAPQLTPAQALEHLPPISNWIRKNRALSNSDWSEEVSAFMDEVDNDIFREATLIPVPVEISGGLDCSLVTTIFPRKRMPGGVLALDALPLLFLTTQANESYALMAELKYWAPAYKQQWLQEAKKMARANQHQAPSKRQKQEPEVLFALEVTSIPPEHIYAIEAAVTQRCSEQNLKCLFLNVGSLCDENKVPVPHSGDLQFLGVDAQSIAVASLLSQILKEHLSEEEITHIHLSGCDLEEFFDRFDWLMDEIQNRGNSPG